MDLKNLFRGKKHETAGPAAPEPPAQSSASEEAQKPPARTFTREEIEQAVIEVLHTIYDPEIPVNIYDLGLVYEVDADESGKVSIQMTLTSPGCPVAGSLIPEIEAKTRLIPGVTKSKVILVWDPPWDPDKMSEAAKLQLGMF